MRKKRIAVVLLLFCLITAALFCNKKEGAGQADPAVVEAAFGAMENRDAEKVTELVMASPSLAFEKDAMNNTELLQASRNGDVRAFGEIVKRHQNSVSAVTYSITGSMDQSEDLAQEAFIVAWRKLETLRNPAALSGWLCG